MRNEPLIGEEVTGSFLEMLVRSERSSGLLAYHTRRSTRATLETFLSTTFSKKDPVTPSSYQQMFVFHQFKISSTYSSTACGKKRLSPSQYCVDARDKTSGIQRSPSGKENRNWQKLKPLSEAAVKFKKQNEYRVKKSYK